MGSILSIGLQWSWLGHVLADIQALLTRLWWFSVCSVHRDVNFETYVLARYVRHILSNVFWSEDSSPPTMEVLYSNLAHLPL